MDELERLLNIATPEQLFSLIGQSIFGNFTELTLIMNIIKTREVLSPELSIQFMEKTEQFMKEIGIIFAKQVVLNANESVTPDDFNPEID